jgi:radical SAM-linked protein
VKNVVVAVLEVLGEVFALKARIKFKKAGALIYIGHLDVMRYFQKAMRRAEIPIAFSGGYSPHMILSFAQPLGVGIYSEGEYLDCELQKYIEPKEAIDRLNEVMNEGIEIVNFVYISEDKKKSGMTIVAAAEYVAEIQEKEKWLATSTTRNDEKVGDAVTLIACNDKQGEWLATSTVCNDELEQSSVIASEAKQSTLQTLNLETKIEEFLAQDEIVVLKKTKRSETEVDIRSMIWEMQAVENGIRLFLPAGSELNLKPNLVISTFLTFCGYSIDELSIRYKRLDIFAKANNNISSNGIKRTINASFRPLDTCIEV